MNRSISDIFEKYMDSLVNLPSEIDLKMNDLRVMDEEFQQHRSAFRKQKRAHLKWMQNSNDNNNNRTCAAGSPTTPSPTSHLTVSSNLPSAAAASLDLVEKEYKAAIDVQDLKIDKARKLYDRLSMHIEQLDNHMAKYDLSSNPLCNQSMRFHYDQRQQSTHDSSSSTASASRNHLQLTTPYDRPPSPMYTDTLENAPSLSRHHHRHQSVREHFYSIEGNRKNASARKTTSSRKRIHYSLIPDPLSNIGIVETQEIDPNEPRYCYCNQVSYGDMIACDNEKCEKEWFHYACAGLQEPPVGEWFCDDCSTN